ncbi:MAG: CoA transferase [Actinomycetota bacterium]|nr:CoA transferase [Actinomycetota bacterium]
MQQPLAGIRVLELAEGIAGPYGAKLLAGYGADVVKVEPSMGDRTRHLGPFPTDIADPESSALHLHLHTNKRSVVLGRAEQLDRLIEWADVIIQSEPVPDPGELRRRFPDKVIVTVTSFGLTGPYAGMVGDEIIHYALGGPMSASGNPDREPVKMGADLGQYECGTLVAVAALAGLARGVGTHVDLSNIETQVGSIDRRMTYLLYGTYRGENVPRFGGYVVGPLTNGCRVAGDGHVQVSTLLNWIPRMLTVLDDPVMTELYSDPMFFFNPDLPEVADAQLLGWTLARTKQDAMDEAQAGGWPITAVNRPVDLLTDKHFTARAYFETVDHPAAGPVVQPGAPIRMEDGWSTRRPAPLLGQHTDEVLAEIAALSGRPTQAPPDPAAPEQLPLEGIRVLDLTVVWAGPYATALLGDLGAEIIRVDNPRVFPSATRGLMARPPRMITDTIGGIFGGYPDAEPGDRPWNRVALFNAHARNKRSVTLDPRTDSGREAFLRLAEQCDVMIENNSVDLLDKLGIGWADLHARNRNLILIRMPSVGLEGPYRSYLGFGVNFEGLCGLTALRGYADADLSENESVFHMDAASGSAGAFAALTALRRRNQTGVGEMIELSQSENMINHIGEYVIESAWTGVEHTPIGNRHRVRAPQGCYPCVGDDAWAVISIGTDAEWVGLGRAAGDPEWASDARFATADGRRARHDEIDELLGRWTAGLTPYEVFDRCQAERVPAAPVLHELEALADPHLRERGMFRPNGNIDTGTHEYPTHVWHWDGPDLRWEPLPILGGDNADVFRNLCGYSEDDYAKLDADGNLSESYFGPDGNPL